MMQPSRTEHALALAPALLMCGALLWVTNPFVTDDAAITLRYSAQLAAGEGLRWNSDVDPVEGYTNLSQVLIGAAALELGLPGLGTLRVINQLAVLALCCIVYALGLRFLQDRRWAGVAALLVGVHAPLMYWASSGLETGLYAAAVYGALWALLAARPASWWPVVPCLLAAITRFEGFVLVGVIAVALSLHALRFRSLQLWRQHARFIVLFVLIYGAYFLWRYEYFGHLLSNSAYYKRNTRNPKLLLELARQCWPLFVLALAAPYRRLGLQGLLLLGVIAAYMLGFARVASSVSYFHRFLLPALPALALLAAAALERIWSLQWRGLPWRAVSGALLALLLVFEAVTSPASIVRVRSMVPRLAERMVSRARTAAFVAQHFPASYALAVGDAGVLGYVLPNPIIDVFGLNDERFTHTFAGNHRRYNRAVLADRPELFVLTSKSIDELQPRYSVERGIVNDARFEARYVWVRKVQARIKNYHYWLFVRRDLLSAAASVAALRSAPEPALALDSHVATLVDELAVRSRQRPAYVTGAGPR